LTEPEY